MLKLVLEYAGLPGVLKATQSGVAVRGAETVAGLANELSRVLKVWPIRPASALLPDILQEFSVISICALVP